MTEKRCEKHKQMDKKIPVNRQVIRDRTRLPSRVAGVMIILLVMAGIPAALSAATPVTGCTKIMASGEYVLQNDIVGPSISGLGKRTQFTCIEITSSGVTFNGNGKKIVGPAAISDLDTTVAIGAKGKGNSKLSNIIVTDVEVSNWHYGIQFSDVDVGTVAKTHVHDITRSPDYSSLLGVTPTGILIEYSKKITLTNNIVENNYNGIHLDSTGDSVIGGEQTCYDPNSPVSDEKTNTIRGNEWHGIQLSGSKSTKNQIIGNSITGNGFSKKDPNNFAQISGVFNGIAIDYSASDNVIKRNKISQNFIGLMLGNAANNQVLGNTLDKNSWYGIYIEGIESKNNIIFSNLIRDNSHSDPIAKDMDGSAIKIGPTAGNIVYNNWIRKGSGDSFVGILVYKNEQFSATSVSAGPNIVNGQSIGGNYWEDAPALPGDSNGDGFADKAFCPAQGTYCTPSSGQINVDLKPLVAPGNWDKNPVYPLEAGISCINSPNSPPPLGHGCWQVTPIAKFNATWIKQPVVSGAPITVQFTDESQAPASWSWNFGDGSTSNEQNPSHEYAKTGTYSVELVIHGTCNSDEYPSESKITKPITVSQDGKPVLYEQEARSLFSPLTDLWERKDPEPKPTLQKIQANNIEGATKAGQDQGFLSTILNFPSQIIMVFTGGPASESQNHFEPVANPASGSGDSSPTLINPVTENSKPGPGIIQQNFGPSTGNTGSGEIAPVPQGDTANVFLPEGGGPVSTTPTPVPAPQVFVPIVTIAEDRGAAPVVEVVTPQGGYKLAPGLRANCTAPLVTCSGACVDLTSDVGNCGACGNACQSGYTCSGSMCVKVMERYPNIIR